MQDVIIHRGTPSLTVEELRLRVVGYLAGTKVERAVLFGSYARGTADASSDVDLLLVEPTDLPFLERGRQHLPLFRLGVGLDLLVYTPDEIEKLRAGGNPLLERIEKEGVLLYARSSR